VRWGLVELVEDNVSLRLFARFDGRVVAFPKVLFRRHGRMFRKLRLKAL
jgi:hypothetical protein